MIDEARIPTMLCQSCQSLLDWQSKCPLCWHGRSALDMLAAQLVFACERRNLDAETHAAVLRDCGPHGVAAADAIERALKRRTESAA